jgi:leader peptidase (prepilin peptidase)/N-methyltransferase
VTPAWLGLVGIVGLIVGSFLNVCIGRLPAGESIAFPGSRCPSCRTPIRWYDNLPVLSYLMLGGRCRACGTFISVRYPVIEVTTALAFVLQALIFGADPVWLASRIVFTAILIALFGTDLETQRLPNVITIPGIVVGLAFSLFNPPGLVECAFGAVLGAALLYGVRWAWKAATGTDGMGLGDVKMLAMIGAFLGWRQVWLVLFLSSLTGAVTGVILAAVGGRSLQSRLPFGTFLAVAAFIASLIGDSLVTWYLSLY